MPKDQDEPICEVHVFLQGPRRITVYEPIPLAEDSLLGKDPPPPIFEGVVEVPMGHNPATGETAWGKINFQIEADTVEGAFRAFDNAAGEAVASARKKFKEEVNKPKIVVPSGKPTGNNRLKFRR
jgi:hypothetical protein